MSDVDVASDEIPDDVIATLSDYLDGVLPPDARPEVEKKLADDPLWQRAHAELQETRSPPPELSTLKRRVAPPQTFEQDVTSTIHKRSAGRFFGRRTFGDRVPFGAILVVALILFAAIGWILRSSPTGSLKKPADKPPTKHERLLDPPT